MTDTNSANDKPTIGETLKKLGDQLDHIGHVATVQGAMGWMYRGDIDRARATLRKLPADKLAEASAAATALASLADEIASSR